MAPRLIGRWSKPAADIDLPIGKPLQQHAFQPQVEMLERSPHVYLSVEAYHRIVLMVALAQLEIGWMGTAYETDAGDFLITDVYLIEQEVTAASTELSVDGLSKLTEALEDQGAEGVEALANLRFWGHSHGNMSTHPSPKDEETLKSFGGQRLPFALRGIFNKKGQASFTLCHFQRRTRYTDLPWEVVDLDDGCVVPTLPLPAKLQPNQTLREQVQAEIAQKVREKRFANESAFDESGAH